MRRLLALGAVVLAATFSLSACSSQSAADLAQQACVHVNRSLHEFKQSQVAGLSSAQSSALQTRAAAELREALPLAASANSGDGSWNALMTTISEEPTVGEAHLVPALRAQCISADTNINVNPQNANPDG